MMTNRKLSEVSYYSGESFGSTDSFDEDTTAPAGPPHPYNEYDHYLRPKSEVYKANSLNVNRADFILELSRDQIDHLTAPINDGILTLDSIFSVYNPKTDEAVEINGREFLETLQKHGIPTSPSASRHSAIELKDYRTQENCYESIKDPITPPATAPPMEMLIDQPILEVQKDPKDTVILPLEPTDRKRSQGEEMRRRKYIIIGLIVLGIIIVLALIIGLSVGLSGKKSPVSVPVAAKSTTIKISTQPARSTSPAFTTTPPSPTPWDKSKNILIFGGQLPQLSVSSSKQVYYPNHNSYNAIFYNTNVSTYSGAVVRIKDIVYLVAGITERGQPTDLVLFYSLSSGKFRSGKSLPHPLANPAASVLGESMYLCGGAQMSGDHMFAVADCHYFTPGLQHGYRGVSNFYRGVCKSNPSVGLAMNENRCLFSMVTVGRSLYAIGGRFVNEIANSVEEMHIQYGTDYSSWKFITPMAQKRSGFGAVEYQGTIVVCGGMTDSFTQQILSQCEQYTPSTKRWQKFPSMNNARYGFSLVQFGANIYAIGGIGGQVDNSVEVYDPTLSRWSTTYNINKGVWMPYIVTIE